MTVASDIDGAARAAQELLDGLGIREPVDWIGEAFGGHVGYKLGRDRTLRTLVAIGAPPETNPKLLRTLRAGLAVVAVLGRGPLVTVLARAQLSAAGQADAPTFGEFREGFLANTRRSIRLAAESFVLRRVDVRSELASIRVPTLIVHGTDRAEWSSESADAAAALIPGAERADIPGARTLVALERPAALTRFIIDFWAGV